MALVGHSQGWGISPWFCQLQQELTCWDAWWGEGNGTRTGGLGVGQGPWTFRQDTSWPILDPQIKWVICGCHYYDLLNSVCQDVNLAHIWLVMAEEEKEKVEMGTSALHDISVSAFLLLGMDIQNIQCISVFLMCCSGLTCAWILKPSHLQWSVQREEADPPSENFTSGMVNHSP